VRLPPSRGDGEGRTPTPDTSDRATEAVSRQAAVARDVSSTSRPESPALQTADIDPLETPRLAVESLDVTRLHRPDSLDMQALEPITPIDVPPLGLVPEGDRP